VDVPIEDANEAALFHMGASKGGHARARRLTSEQRSAIARQAAEARWDGKTLRAPHSGILKIGDTRIECAVLDDGTRVISQGTILEALGRERNTGRKKGDPENRRPPFLSAQNLEPFISAELMEKLTPIEYKMPGQRFISLGYRAETLPEVCDVYLAARAIPNTLQPNQFAAANAAEVLIRSLAKVGIIALVDEATGYQAARAQDELRRLLEQYVNEEFRTWVKTFPDLFFVEIYRLHGWRWVDGNRKHPQYVGHFINQYIYDHLPEGVADELRRVNPVNASGRRSRKHHQHLTVDTGSIHLDRQITAVTTLMQVSRSIDEFKDLFDRRFAKVPPKVLRVQIGSGNEVMTLFEVDEPTV